MSDNNFEKFKENEFWNERITPKQWKNTQK